MRVLHHPRVEEITVQGILHALSDPVRMQIFMQLAAADCPKSCTTFVNVSHAMPLAKSTLSQHFRVLREAGLIHSERRGVELHNRTRCSELKDRYGEMIGAIIQAHSAERKKKKL